MPRTYDVGVDPYLVLGVPRDAPVAEIRRAYAALARSTHPDVRGDDPDAAERMRRINLAWEMLSDAGSRAVIDRSLRQQPSGSLRPRAAPESEPAVRPGQDDLDISRDGFDGDDLDISRDGFDGDDLDISRDGFDGDDRPLTGGSLPAWMRGGAPLAFVAGILAVVFGVLASGFALVRLGLLALGFSALLFLLAPFVVLIRSRGGPMR